MAELCGFVGHLAEQHVDEMSGAETLSGAIDAGQRLLRGQRAFPGLRWLQAVVAIAAGPCVVFAEILQQALPSAPRNI